MLFRTRSGNTLALIAAVTIIGALVIIFSLLYISMLRSSTEHKTAIEAAALAAAKDLSRIVIDTNEWGLVGLSTQAPAFSDTEAPDEYYQDVHSINELMGTARLDMIIAHEIGDAFMEKLARQDLADTSPPKTS